MKWFVYICVPCFFILNCCCVGANLFGDSWNYWGQIAGGFWHFGLAFGLYPFYRKQTWTVWIIDILWLLSIGFTTIWLCHAIWCLAVFSFTDQTIDFILNRAFNEYNIASLFFSGLIVLGTAIAYLMNFGNIWRSIWKK